MRTRKFLAALALSLALPAHAVGRYTDSTDLWWNAGQSGWGVNVIQQNEILFLTFFVYSASRNPVWYSASEMRLEASTGGVLVYTGALYETHGPWLADNFFDSASVSYRQVGTVMFRLNSVGSATLIYSVDGLTVQKLLTRFTWRVNEVDGSYLGALAGTNSECVTPTSNGYVDESLQIVVTQTSTNLAIQATGATATCVYSGTYVQEGRMGSMRGPYTCTNGVFGSFQASEIEANPQMFSARVTANTNSCNFSGRIGGVRRGN